MQAANPSSIWINASSTKKQHAFTKQDQMKGAAFKYIFFLILLAFFCSLFYIWSRIQVVNIGYEINRSLALKEKLIEENKKLSLEAATLKSPVRLESLAYNQFHMDLPQKSQILNQWVAPKSVEVVAQPEKKIPAKIVKKPQDSKMKMTEKPTKEINLKSTKKTEAKSQLKIASAVSSPTKR